MDRQKKGSREHFLRVLLDLAPQPPTLELIPFRQVERTDVWTDLSLSRSHAPAQWHLRKLNDRFSIYALTWPLSSINQIWSHCKQSSFLIFSCHKCKKKKVFPTIWDRGVLFKTYRFSCAECLCLKSQRYEAEAGGLLCLWLDLDTEWVLVSK